MKEAWKAAVLTPVHNTPVELLDRAYNSLKRQSIPFREIQWVVVLHNCSPDYIESVKKLLGDQPNICLSEVRQEDTGVSFARNATLDRARGKYLFFLDSDDEMEPECVETVVSAMEQTRADTAIFTAKGNKSGWISHYYTDADPAMGTQAFEKGDHRISKSMCIAGMTLWTRCYRRDFVKKEGGRFDQTLKFGEDYMFNIRMTGLAARVCVLPWLTGYTYYAGIGMTSQILPRIQEASAREPDNGESKALAAWGNEGTGIFIRSVWFNGYKYGLRLDNVIWKLLSQFGKLIMFSEFPQARKDNYVETIRPLVKQLDSPVMEWKEIQAEMDDCFQFVQAMIQAPVRRVTTGLNPAAGKNMEEKALIKEAQAGGRLRILENCPGGFAYLAGTERRRQVIYMILDLGEDVQKNAFDRALADIRERYPVTRQFLLQLDGEYYSAEMEGASDDHIYRENRVIGGAENGYHSFDAAIDGTRIILSVDHSLMDGGALMEITEYFASRYAAYSGENLGAVMEKDPGASSGKAAATAWHTDLFSLPCEKDFDTVRGFDAKAFQPFFADKKLDTLVEITVPTEQVLSICKGFKTSPSLLFSVILARALREIRGPEETAPIVVAIPIDYREQLKVGNQVKTAAFSAAVNLDSPIFSEKTLPEQAEELRAYIRRMRDARTARGWIRFFRECIIPMNSQLFRREGRTEKFDAYTFMLSYLRPFGQDIYRGKHLLYSGVSIPNDFCMLEYGENFHLWIRPLRSEDFISIFLKELSIQGLGAGAEVIRGASLVSAPIALKRDELPPAVFVFVSPAFGHVMPLLPLIEELGRRGRMVRVYTGSSVRKKIEEAGAACVSYDAFYEMGHYPEQDAYGFLRMLELAGCMDETVGRDTAVFRPEFAIVDSESIWGRLLAEKHGLKVVFSSATQIMNMWTAAEDWGSFFKGIEPYEERIGEMLEELSEKGFPKHTLLSLLIPGQHMDCIAYIPRELQGHPERLEDGRVYFAGFSRNPGDGEDTRIAGSAGRKNRPLIYVTMGTVSSRSPWFFRSCIEAFRNMEADVVMAVWNYIDTDILGNVPEHIRILREADQGKVLQEADAALFHGGLNTVTDCLLRGVPMVVYPTVADQFANAKRVEENGVGIRIGDHRPDTIRKAVSRILAEPVYRENAARLGKRMKTMGGAKGAAAWILERKAEKTGDEI